MTLFYQGKLLRNSYAEKLVNRITGRDLLSYLIMEIMKFCDDISKNSIRQRFVKFQQVLPDIGI